MRMGTRAIVALLTATLTLSTAGVYGTPAMAADDPALPALTQVVPDIVEESRTEPPLEIPEGNVQRAFSAVADHTLRLNVSDVEIGIGLPEATGAGNRPLPGLATYTSTRPSVAFAHQRTGQIGRVLTVIKDASAPTEYRFPITAPEGSTLEVEEDDQTVIIYNEDVYLGEIDLPWAKDANGNPVPTSYRVEGMTLIQTVNHAGAAYPVVADPALKLQCEWWKAMCRVIFSKKLTKKISGRIAEGAAAAAAALSEACARVKNGKVRLICMLAVNTGIFSFASKIKEAASKGQCFAIRAQWPGPILWGEVRKKSCSKK